ncbi:putative RNA-directed DNA polymerase from transposon X-element [Stylophora pistillata]|uniref:Putative RNA-directed DNA polymerase from transposon X-element n=1 Tax=Stylophora pistillata TaxID=50429 RepID=A0A2B4RCE6_STYPI|nr:putative RNA-directed DNA polymerase from transposon X-element [Stylophora pistillata]
MYYTPDISIGIDGFGLNCLLASSEPPLTGFQALLSHNRQAYGSNNPSTKRVYRRLLFSLLLLGGDIQINPGPTWKFPCGSCNILVKKNQRGIQCDLCDLWYHTKCCAIGDDSYCILANSSCSWLCVSCGFPSFSNSLSETDFDLQNSFSSRESLTQDTPNMNSTFIPQETSPCSSGSRNRRKQRKPRNKIAGMILNCNDLKGTDHITKFQALLDLYNPDVILGTESKRCLEVSTYSIFPQNYTVFRRDRNRLGGGVFLAIKSDLVCIEEPDLEVESFEIVWTSLKLTNYSSSKLFTSDPEKRTVEENWNMFKTSLTTGMSQFIPQKSSHPRYKLPWVNNNIQREMRKKERMHKRAIRSKKTQHWEAFKRQRNLVYKLIKESHNSYLNDVIGNSLSENPRKFWSYVRNSSHMAKHLSPHNIVINHQHGFRENFSCETQLISAIHDWAKGINLRSQTDVLLLDFSTAFDTVPHERLLIKLDYYGIRGNMFNRVRALLSNRKQSISVNGTHSSSRPVVSGVPQGFVLGPALLLLFINDISNSIQSKLRLFAEDCVLHREQGGETVDEFCSALKTLAKNSYLGDKEESWITSMLVLGLKDPFSKERLMEREESLEKTLQAARGTETSKRHMRSFKEESSKVEKVDVVDGKGQKPQGGMPCWSWSTSWVVMSQLNQIISFGGNHEEAFTRSTLTAATDVGPTPALSRNKCGSFQKTGVLNTSLKVLVTHDPMAGQREQCRPLKQCWRKLMTHTKLSFPTGIHPLEEVNLSPSQMLMRRRLRTSLPVTEDFLKPQLHDPEDVLPKLKERQRKQKPQHDRKAKELPPLRDGEVVRVKEGNKWKPARVTQVLPSPRSYKVETERGEYRRNRRHLLRNEEPQIPEITPTPEVSIDNNNNNNNNNYNNNLIFILRKLTCRYDQMRITTLFGGLWPEDLTDTEVEPSSVIVAHDNPVSVTPPTGMSMAITTRSGRTIREPQRFKDHAKY